MGSCSTHHITVTKRMMARKKAKRKQLANRKLTYYKGKFGDVINNRLADRFKKTNRKDIVKNKSYSLSYYLDVSLLELTFVGVPIILWVYLGYC